MGVRSDTGTLQPSIKLAGAFQATKSSLQALCGMPQAFQRRVITLANSYFMEDLQALPSLCVNYFSQGKIINAQLEQTCTKQWEVT